MRFEKEGVMYHLSRLAESIRTSGNLHEFQNREVPDEDGEDVSMKFNIIEGTEWYPILRYGTPRVSTFRDRLAPPTKARRHSSPCPTGRRPFH